jgi:hypothetical protein
MGTLGVPAGDIVRVLVQGALALTAAPIAPEEVRSIAERFVQAVYMEQSLTREQALADVPDTEIGRAFRAAERLVQPTRFA